MADTLSDHGSKYPLVVAVLGAFLGSSGSVALVFNSPLGKDLSRPDPFTGSQGAALEQRLSKVQSELSDIKVILNRDMTRHEERLNNLEKHHADLEREFDEWVKYHNENFVPAKHLEPKRTRD